MSIKAGPGPRDFSSLGASGRNETLEGGGEFVRNPYGFRYTPTPLPAIYGLEVYFRDPEVFWPMWDQATKELDPRE